MQPPRPFNREFIAKLIGALRRLWHTYTGKHLPLCRSTIHMHRPRARRSAAIHTGGGL